MLDPRKLHLGDVDEKNSLGFRIGVQGDSCTNEKMKDFKDHPLR